MPTRSAPIACAWSKQQDNTQHPTHPNNGVQHLPDKAEPILNAAAILVRALVRARLQELVQQISVGAVQLNTVKPSCNRVLSSLCKVL